jgi:hypothetical protein
MALILVCNQRCNIGLDTASTETNDNDGCGIATKRSTGINCGGKRGSPQEEQANPVDTGKDEDGLVAAEILISDDGTKNWSDYINAISNSFTARKFCSKLTVAKPLEEEIQSSGTLLA